MAADSTHFVFLLSLFLLHSPHPLLAPLHYTSSTSSYSPHPVTISLSLLARYYLLSLHLYTLSMLPIPERPNCIPLPDSHGGICGNCRYTNRDHCTLRWHGEGNHTTWAWRSLLATRRLSNSERSSSSFTVDFSRNPETLLGSSQSAVQRHCH